MALPTFNELSGQQFQLNLNSGLVMSLLGGILAITLILAGLYPAWLLSRFQPMSILRNRIGFASGRSPLRQGLVLLQFTISAALLACTIVIWQQRQFIQNKPIGYNRSEVFTFNMSWQVWRNMGQERAVGVRNAIQQVLQSESSVAEVSISSQSSVHIESTHSGSVRFDGMAEGAQPTVAQMSADANFASLFDLQLLEGRWFTPDSKADESHVVLNENAARELGLR
jgi:putative ABC transport system permease protein